MTNCRYQEGRIVPITCDSNENFRNTSTDAFRIFHISSGCVALVINRQKYYLAGQALLLFPQRTEIEVISANRLHASSVSFSPSFINVNLTWDIIEASDYPLRCSRENYPRFDAFYKRNTIYEGILPLDPETDQAVGACMAQICTQIREQPQPEWSCRTRSLIFKVMDLADHFCQPFFEASVDDNIEQSVLDYIHANLYDPIRIEDLCRHFHTNRTTLCRRFKAYCGQSIAQYVQKQRIAQTKYALAFTELSIEDIAIQYGFGDAVYFCKVFKKQVGVSPSVFRKDAKSSRLQVGIAQ